MFLKEYQNFKVAYQWTKYFSSSETRGIKIQYKDNENMDVAKDNFTYLCGLTKINKDLDTK